MKRFGGAGPFHSAHLMRRAQLLLQVSGHALCIECARPRPLNFGFSPLGAVSLNLLHAALLGSASCHLPLQLLALLGELVALPLPPVPLLLGALQHPLEH